MPCALRPITSTPTSPLPSHPSASFEPLPPPAPSLLTPPPSPLCLCSHHNKPGADGASAPLCLAHGDRQPLPANSLPGNQLTGLDSARCCCNSSSPTVGGGGEVKGRRRRRQQQWRRRRRMRRSAGATQQQTPRGLQQVDRRESLSAGSDMRLPAERWD